MKNKILLLFFCNSILCVSVYGKSRIKDSVNKLDEMILNVSYSEKTSYFQFKKNSNHENELYLIIDGQTRQSRKISSKDLVWLEKRLSSFTYDSRTPNSKCELGEISLSVQHLAKTKNLKRCLGAEDKMTKELLTLTRTLRTFL